MANMNRSFYYMAVSPIVHGLKNSVGCFNKAIEHAKANNIDPESYLEERLIDDMKNLRDQIYRFTDSANLMTGRVNPAVTALSLPDDEQTWAQLIVRIEKVIKHLESLEEKSFEGQEEQEVVQVFGGGAIELKWAAVEYVTKFAHPNFWFHFVTAYDILRHKGVPVGKFDFMNASGLVPVKHGQKQES